MPNLESSASIPTITSDRESSPTSPAAACVVNFWGVRGGIPTPGKNTVQYGGNTVCVEVLVNGQRLVFDGGTGLRVLGQSLLSEMPLEAHLFFTHSHWDRIQGFPFFTPAFIEGNHFHIYGTAAVNGASMKQRLSDQMLRPHFPLQLQIMQATLEFHDLLPGDMICLGEVTVETASLNYPTRALGFRVSWQDHAIVYATDTECEIGQPNSALARLAKGADLLIYDIADTAEECYGPHRTNNCWQDGWRTGVEVAQAAGAKQLVLMHHSPAYDDAYLDQVSAQLQAAFPKGLVAREGMRLHVS